MKDGDSPDDRVADDRIDATTPRPDRRTPYRNGQGHGDGSTGAPVPDAGLTGDDVDAGDGGADATDEPSSGDGEDLDDVERYRDSPGASLLRGDDTTPEPNEPG